MNAGSAKTLFDEVLAPPDGVPSDVVWLFEQLALEALRRIPPLLRSSNPASHPMALPDRARLPNVEGEQLLDRSARSLVHAQTSGA